QLDKVTHRPAWLAASADERQQSPGGRTYLGQAAVDDGRVLHRAQATLDQFAQGPLIARLAEAPGDLAQQRLVVGVQGPAQTLGPRGRIGQRHGEAHVTTWGVWPMRRSSCTTASTRPARTRSTRSASRPTISCASLRLASSSSASTMSSVQTSETR